MRNQHKALWILGLSAILACALPAMAANPQELSYSGADFAKLDTFEGANLGDADKLFTKGDFKGAYAAYKAYSSEFGKSKAMPYVLLRMGRCLHRMEKRNAAIQAYQDVVDYFPNDTTWAAAALFYIGQCHGQNGEEAKQTAVWARMVKDDAYVAQPNSGTALTFLADAMAKLGKFEEATSYHWRTAVAFRATNASAASAAREAVRGFYVSRSPNHDKLKEFYVAAGGFDGHGAKTDKPEDDARYWSSVLSTALQTGEAAQKESACAYWSAKVGDRFATDDAFCKLAADVRMVHEKNRASWFARMDKQFLSKPATIDRVMQWCDYYRIDPAARAAFFAKHGVPASSGLDTAAKIGLIGRMIQAQGMTPEAQAVMRTIRAETLSDEELVKLAGVAAQLNEPEDAVLSIFSRMKDKLAATKARFDYYNSRSHRNPPFMEKALAEIPALKQSPSHAGQALIWTEATLLHGLGRFEDAIKAYRNANRQPDSTWAIADCLVSLKQYAQAITTVREIEAVGGATASMASLKAADIHRASGDKAKEVEQLRIVLKRYPKSSQSSDAHNRLEKYGAALVGGEADTDK